MRHTLAFAMAVAMTAAGLLAPGSAVAEMSVFTPRSLSLPEALSGREVRRYVYLRTGRLLTINRTERVADPGAEGVVVGQKGRPLVRALAAEAGLGAAVDALQAQHYLIKTIDRDGRRLVLIAGGDDIATLYGAYRFAEQLGIRFYMHGDVIPDERVELRLPSMNVTAKPLFELRGIQPFHDFPEGPDWWRLDDYKAILSQLPKLGMNFFGLHTYPEGGVGPEPAVWIGTAEDIARDGAVTFSYPARHFTTLNGTWGYHQRRTSSYHLGTSALFEHDAYGHDVMIGKSPWPPSPDACNELFNEFGVLLRDAFMHAFTLRIKTCIGTETPLTVPKAVKRRLESAGKNPDDPAVIQSLYEGMFRRIASAYHIDYYWLWTPEGWTWSGTTDEQVEATLQDLRSAIAAAAEVKAPFTLATCGWVLGPPQNRALFDNVLPKKMPMSCINRQVGKDPVEPGFAQVTGRPQWAIPWLEDDPALTAPQLWVGRMRRDAFDALRYGCTGLMGIHWRTRILAPNVSALAKAAWDQSGWSEGAVEPTEILCKEGVMGGRVAHFPNNPITDTEDDALYQSVRYDLSAYRLAVPNGEYTVTLRFCEPYYSEKGKRAFDVSVQGQRVLNLLDVFAKVGQNKALDYTYRDIKVTDGRLEITFRDRTEFACIAALEVAGGGYAKKINCGGPAYRDFVADLPVCPPPPRDLPATDFYADWAATQFGPKVGPAIAAVFDRLDGEHHQPTTWVHGPGGIKPDPTPWAEVRKAYAFVDELAALRPQVKSAGNRERFDYWLGNFRYMRAIAQVNCTWARYNKAAEKIKAAGDPQAKQRLAREAALPIRKELIKQVVEVYRHLLPTVSNTGELGTVVNWEQHIVPELLNKPAETLVKVLGEPLPADVMLPKEYRGPPHLIVPTVRTSLGLGGPLRLKAIVLAEAKPRSVTLFWKVMGPGEFKKLPFTHVARGVYTLQLDGKAIGRNDIEYYVEMTPASGQAVRFPATAPTLNQTVVVVPGGW